MQRGGFGNLPSNGKPIDLTEDFESPEEVRLANSLLQSAGMTSREVDLLKEIAELRKALTALHEKKKWRQERSQEITGQIQQKQLGFSLMMDRQRSQK